MLAAYSGLIGKLLRHVNLPCCAVYLARTIASYQFAEIKCKLFIVAIFLSYIYILTEKKKIVFVK